jgi:hypothetical protein
MFLKKHGDLDVWKLAIRLVKDAYIMTKNFPVNEQYGLVSQISKDEIKLGKDHGIGLCGGPIYSFTHIPIYALPHAPCHYLSVCMI